MATFAGRYDEVLIRNVSGRLLPMRSGTTVQVYEADGTTPATLYTDRTKGTTAANPVTPSATGELEFWAEPGDYVLSILESGSQVGTDEVSVPADPAEALVGGGGTGGIDGGTADANYVGTSPIDGGTA